MKAKRPMHEDHLVFAQLFHELCSKFRDLRDAADCFPKTHRISDAFRTVRKRLDLLQHELDTEYHAVTSEEQFRKSGHIYYGCR